MEHEALYQLYKQKVLSTHELGDENLIADIEEAHYIDHVLGHEQFGTLMALYAEITGDHSMLGS